MPRKGENIYKRKDGRWEGRIKIGYHENGRIRYQSIYAHSYKELVTRMNQHTKEMIIQKHAAQAQIATSSVITVEKDPLLLELLEEWLKKVQYGLKESSYNRYYNHIYGTIIPILGTNLASHITTSDLQSFINSLLTGNNNLYKTLSPKTLRDILAILKRALSFASKKGIPIQCDCSDVYLHVKECPLDVLSVTEQQCLIQYLASIKSPCETGVLLVLFTGLRIGEICALQWKNIHLDEGYLMVNSSMQRVQIHGEKKGKKTKVIISTPKSTCSIRKIPLPEYMIHFLRPYQQQDSCFLLTGTQYYIEPRTLENRFKKILQKLSLRHIKFHTLRHTFATRCIESGFDVKSLSEILGHANVNITLNRYVHPSQELKLKNMQKLEHLLMVKNMVKATGDIDQI